MNYNWPLEDVEEFMVTKGASKAFPMEIVGNPQLIVDTDSETPLTIEFKFKLVYTERNPFDLYTQNGEYEKFIGIFKPCNDQEVSVKLNSKFFESAKEKATMITGNDIFKTTDNVEFEPEDDVFVANDSQSHATNENIMRVCQFLKYTALSDIIGDNEIYLNLSNYNFD